ncbi:MAG: PilZ domain-containing protein [Myxococcota bacterium]
MADTTGRRDRRINVALHVAVRDEEVAYLTKNLSAGGLFLITPHRYPIGSFLSLKLDYKGLMIDTGARVTHLQRDGVGVRFWNPSAEMQRAIVKVIDDLLASGHATHDRRREPRSSIESTPVLWRRGELEHRAELSDLSLSGARIRGAELPEEGERILLLMPTPSPDSTRDELDLVGSDATVRRVLEQEFGVEFDAPSAEFRLAVARLLQDSGQSSSRQV